MFGNGYQTGTGIIMKRSRCQTCGNEIIIYSNPQGPQSGSYRVLRGGSWDNSARYLRSAGRNYFDPGYRGYVLGFRLVRTKAPSSLLPSEVKHETKD
jgi:formylglycine-generating enzyme required for sulfatase activity